MKPKPSSFLLAKPCKKLEPIVKFAQENLSHSRRKVITIEISWFSSLKMCRTMVNVPFFCCLLIVFLSGFGRVIYWHLMVWIHCFYFNNSSYDLHEVPTIFLTFIRHFYLECIECTCFFFFHYLCPLGMIPMNLLVSCSTIFKYY